MNKPKKTVVKENLTSETNSEKPNLIAEEKAREYAGDKIPIEGLWFGSKKISIEFQNAFTDTKYESFLSGYHSRDEEVQELREALGG